MGESDSNGLGLTLPNAIVPIIGLGSAAIDVRPLSAGIVLQHGRSQTLEKRFYEFVCQYGPIIKYTAMPKATLVSKTNMSAMPYGAPSPTPELYQPTPRRPPSPPIIHLAGILPSNGAMDRAIDARLRWLDGNLPRLVMPLNKCRIHGEEAKEDSNEGSALEKV